ncbi:MAG: hypothetical protein AB1486_16210 [Planctomycetota bacterium]
MKALRTCLLLLLLLPPVVASPGLSQDESKENGTDPSQDEARAEQKQPEEESSIEERALAAHQAIRRGFEFLRKTQAKDGAWGSHDPVVIDSSQLGFGMLEFGSHDGVRTACTGICAKALLLYPLRTKEDDAALHQAIKNLLANWKLAYDPGNAFNVWGYAFNLDFLTTLYNHSLGKPYRKELEEVVPKVIGGLKKMQVAEGGWAYYTSVMMEGASISFTTASILLPLMRAKHLGFEVPEGMIADAGNIIKTQQLPSKNFIYGTYLKYTGDHHLEDLSCGGRTLVCGLAVHLFDKSFTRADLIDRHEHYFKNIDYVEKIGNKRIIPHRDAPQNISGYFLYYGAYYAAEVMTYLGKDAKEANWDHLQRMIVRNQEGEGSWWDTICYDYGDKWGTGFAILCLEHYLRAKGFLEVVPIAEKPAVEKQD